MTTLLISTFKAKCIEVINAVHDGGESVVVTRRGKPLAKIVPMTELRAKRRKLGASPGELTIRGDIVHGDLSGDWESLS
jgi:prevent-host-death family protein